MAEDLRVIIKLARHEVDERRRALAALFEQEQAVVDRQQALARELQTEQDVAAQDATGVGYLYGAYHLRYVQRRDSLAAALAEVRAAIDGARDLLAESFRQLKTYEVAQAQRERREREEAEHKERIFLDEVGQIAHQRHQTE